MPKVMFNHLFFLMDAKDIEAISNSKFMRDKLVAFHEEDKVIANGVRVKGIYLDGVDNMVEIMDSMAIKPLRFFDSVGFNSTVGRSGLVFSVEKLGELDQLKTILSKYQFKKYNLNIQENGKKIPWFTKLNAADSMFYRQSYVFYMIQEFRKEFYDYKHLPYSGNELTREAFNKDVADKIKDKIIKRFSGVTLKLNYYETNYFTSLFEAFDFRKVGDNRYTSPDGFTYTLKNRLANDIYSIESIEFETNSIAKKQTVNISDNVFVVVDGKKGYIHFK